MTEHSLSRAVEEQEKGNFFAAKAILEALLLQSPNHTELSDRLAYINIQLGLYDEAKTLLIQAIERNPHVTPLLYIHLGQVYRQLKQWIDAESCYKQALLIFPNSPDIFYEYGLLHYQIGNYHAAELDFITALKLKPNYIEAMYNLALSLKKQDKKQDALACLLAILEYEPRHSRSRFLLGKWLLIEGQGDEAEKHFKQLLNLQPHDPVLISSIIKCYLDQSCFKQAKPYCQKFIGFYPRAFDMYYNLGVIAAHEGHFEEAISYYQSALTIYPEYFPALNNLAILYLKQQNTAAASHYLKEALKQQPDNISLKYTLSALSGNFDYEGAPQDYIRDLFDQYADHFDQHLCEALDYCVPLKLKLLIEKHFLIPEKQWVILDLGCGTGLCGQFVKAWAGRLIGIDLSPRMLNMAKQKKLYDELMISENLDYLRDKTDQFDLIIAGDVLVYQGNLQPLFFSSYRALKQDGLLAFSTEAYLGHGFLMQSTGRFSHSLGYIKELASSTGYRIVDEAIDMTRLQGNEPLAGYYFILQKG